MNKNLVIVADYTEHEELSLEEFCTICHLPSETILNFVQYDIVRPQGANKEEWIFDLAELKRIQRALRLERDLELNLSGVAVVLDLLDEMENLRARVQLFEKHYK